jgi:hypothetical protein
MYREGDGGEGLLWFDTAADKSTDTARHIWAIAAHLPDVNANLRGVRANLREVVVHYTESVARFHAYVVNQEATQLPRAA